MKNDRNRSGKTRPFQFEGSQEMSCVGVTYLKSNFRIQSYHSSRYVVVKNQSTATVVERQSS